MEASNPLLQRGKACFDSGNFIDARDELYAYLKQRPDDDEALHLLGTTCYRLKLYDEAIEQFGRIIGRHPDAHTVYTNIGMAFLKASQPDKAVIAFKKSLALHPQQPNTERYLGLAETALRLKGKGSEEGQGETFVATDMEGGTTRLVDERDLELGPDHEAGTVAQTEDRVLDAWSTTAPPAPPTPPVAAKASAKAKPAKPAKSAPAVSVQPMPAPATASIPPAQEPPSLWTVSLDDVTPAAAEPALESMRSQPPKAAPAASLSAATPEPAAVAQPAASLPEPTPVTAPAPAAIRDLASLTETCRLMETQESLQRVNHGLVRLNVRANQSFFARTQSIVYSEGEIRLEPRYKKWKGKKTNVLFGSSADPIMEVTGEGILILQDDLMEVFRLEDEVLYVVEEAVLGFDSEVRFENGALQAGQKDINLVQFKGRGNIVLRGKGRLVSTAIREESPARVLPSAIVGWYGRLLPQPKTLATGEEGGLLLLELRGEGHVLFQSLAASHA